MNINIKLENTFKTENDLRLNYYIEFRFDEGCYVDMSASAIFECSYSTEDGAPHEWDTPQINLHAVDLARGLFSNTQRMMVFAALLEQIDRDAAPLID